MFLGLGAISHLNFAFLIHAAFVSVGIAFGRYRALDRCWSSYIALDQRFDFNFFLFYIYLDLTPERQWVGDLAPVGALGADAGVL